MRLLGLAGLMGLLVASAMPVAAQAEPTAPTLQLGDGTASTPAVAAGAAGKALVPWSYQFSNQAAASAAMAFGGTTLGWTLTCPEPGIALSGGAVTNITFETGQAVYEGIQELEFTATREAPGEESIPCTAEATGASPGPGVPATETASATAPVRVAFYGALEANLTDASKQGGPQDQITYDLELRNAGNSQAVVHFALLDEPKKGWMVILPAATVLEAGETRTIPLLVSTPFHNGRNTGSTDIEFSAMPVSTRDPNRMGEAVPLHVEAKVDGWYVPSPSVALAAALLLVAAAVPRRR